MSLHIKNVSERGEWDKFLYAQKPQTFLQSWNWGEFNRETGSKIFRLGVYDKSVLIGLALILKVEAKRGSFLFCPHGPVENFEFRISNFELFFIYLKNLAKKEKCSFVRVSPLIKNSDENNRLFLNNGFREAPIHMMHPESAWILDVQKSEDELLKGMRKSTRYSIKKAIKDGITVEKSQGINNLEKFWEVYSETSSRHHFVPFSKKYLQKELDIFLKDNEIVIFFAKVNGEVASASIVVFDKNSGYYHHGASRSKFSKTTASQLIQWEAIREAKKRGCRYYNFWGVVSDEQKNHPWHGISIFKRGFGGFSEEYVHAKDYVVDWRYWINFVIEWARRKKRRL